MMAVWWTFLSALVGCGPHSPKSTYGAAPVSMSCLRVPTWSLVGSISSRGKHPRRSLCFFKYAVDSAFVDFLTDPSKVSLMMSASLTDASVPPLAGPLGAVVIIPPGGVGQRRPLRGCRRPRRVCRFGQGRIWSPWSQYWS